MGSWVRWIIMAGILGGYVACSPKQFSKDPNYRACQEFNQACVSENGLDHFDYSETILGGKIDILVVDDNSASMSYEQTQLATRFGGFIQNLDSKYIQYRIGVVTTDISSSENEPRAINGDGALQDGRLIAFSGVSGSTSYLTPQSANSLSQKETAFSNVIRRPETAACEAFILGWSGSRFGNPAYDAAYKANCPSGDERGILAAGLALQRNQDGFIRPEADLAVIILSDENVRSNQTGQFSEGDTANGFKSFMQNQYPSKTYAVHSIVTLDASCLAQQNSQTGGLVSGSYGWEYYNLSTTTGGVYGSICASTYGPILSSIFNNLQSKMVDKLPLACSAPLDLTVTLTNNSDPTITWTQVGPMVQFSKKLPVGTTVRVKYSCITLG